MTNNGVTQLLYLMDETFAGPDWESLLQNLRSVRAEDWLWVPPGGQRSICEMVRHVGGCKFMYHNQAFGDGSYTWAHPLVAGHEHTADLESAVAWLREGHARLHASVAALTDSQLLELRGHHSGKPREIRWLVSMMIQHDAYHAGEINLLRALHQGDDE